MSIRITGDTSLEPGRRVLEFEGLAAGFHVPFVVRGGPFILRPGAFLPTLNHPRLRRTIRILHDHDPARSLGRPLELREDEDGLFVRASLASSARTEDVIRQMLSGELGQLSIGFSYGETSSGEIRGLVLHEISIVRKGANPLALIASAAISERVPHPRQVNLHHWRALPDDERVRHESAR
jgi:HK97 family phage prohead protease